MMNNLASGEKLRRLQAFADQMTAFMETPVFWDLFRRSSFENHVFDTSFPDQNLLGDRLRRHIERSFNRVCVFIEGTRDLTDRLQAAVDYLNAASDEFNRLSPIDCPSREVLPAEVCLDYTLGRRTPVDSLLDLVQTHLADIQGLCAAEAETPVGWTEDTDVNPSDSHNPPRAKSKKTSQKKGFAVATAEIPPAYCNRENGKPFEPLTGNGRTLARAISGNETARRDYLLKHHEGMLFVRQLRPNELEVYFSSMDKLVKSRDRFEKAKLNRKPAVVKPLTANDTK